MEEIENIYSYLGAKFISSPAEMRTKLNNIKAFIFDWDGVFNNGQKDADGSSNFNEIDSMGTNLLRYSYFLKHGKSPVTAIISGETNKTAFFFSKRECFNYSFYKVADKIHALNFICEKENIKPNEVAYFFDDVLDLSVAEQCGVRILVNRKANPLFINYCIKNNLVDYLTQGESGNFVVREGAEVLISLNENYDDVLLNRMHYTESYAAFIAEKRQIKTQFFTQKEKKIVGGDPS